jgi:hypothetical protein
MVCKCGVEKTDSCYSIYIYTYICMCIYIYIYTCMIMYALNLMINEMLIRLHPMLKLHKREVAYFSPGTRDFTLAHSIQSSVNVQFRMSFFQRVVFPLLESIGLVLRCIPAAIVGKPIWLIMVDIVWWCFFVIHRSNVISWHICNIHRSSQPFADRWLQPQHGFHHGNG